MADYLNNKEFYKLLIDYRKVCDEAAAAGEDIPRIPEDIGKAFYLIATNTANRGNFIGYTYKDEMISDGIENCLLYIDNFNPEKSSNPFAYFTQIIYYAFIRRIQKEKKQTYVKYKSLENQELIDEIMQGPNGTPVKNNFMEFIQSNMDDFLSDFEETQRKKKEKAKEKRNSKETETP